MKKLFTKKSVKRQWTMLALSVAVLVVTIVAMVVMPKADIAQQFGLLWQNRNVVNILNIVCLALLLADMSAIVGALIYLNATSWMLPLLHRALFMLFGWLPFVDMIDPKELDPELVKEQKAMKAEFQEKKKQLEELEKGSAEYKALKSELAQLHKQLKNMDLRKASVEDRRPAPLPPELPVAKKVILVIADVIWYILRVVVYLLGAIGIPLLSPLLTLTLTTALYGLTAGTWVFYVVSILLFLIVMLLDMAYPVTMTVIGLIAKFAAKKPQLPEAEEAEEEEAPAALEAAEETPVSDSVDQILAEFSEKLMEEDQ